MDEKFLCGIAFGMFSGALLATHSIKTRQMLKEGEEQVKQKVKKLTQPSTKKN